MSVKDISTCENHETSKMKKVQIMSNQKPVEKLSFASSNVKSYWDESDWRTSKIIETMDNVETWTKDDDREVLKTIVDIGSRLNNADNEIILNKMDDLMKMNMYISSSRSLVFMKWLSSKHPETYTALMRQIQSSTEPEHMVAKKRLSVFNKLNLLSSIFGPERSAIIKEITLKLKDDNTAVN